MSSPLNIRGAVDLSSLAAPRPAAGPAAAPAPPGVIVDVDDAGFAALVERSQRVPVVVDLWAEWCQPCRTLGPLLERLAAEYAGSFQLAKVDVDANPQIAAAFQVQSIPTVVAILAGQPVPLFQGAYPESQIRQILEQLLALAAQHGITGRVAAKDPQEPAPAPEPPLPPLHAAAIAAIEEGDLEGAAASYRQALKENPRDTEARAALAQVELMTRLDGTRPEAVIAAAVPGDLASQLAAADAEMSSGWLREAFARLLGLIREGGEVREPARLRLLDFFEVAGPTNPEVVAARRHLASALY